MGKMGMTPTPAKMRQEAVQGVFAGPLDQKKQRPSERRRCQRRQADRNFARRMFREIVGWLIAHLMRECSANRNERRYAAALAAVQGGADAITGFNLEFYPAVGESVYDVTFNSLAVTSAVPEPSTLALVGSGIAGLLAFCRRNK